MLSTLYLLVMSAVLEAAPYYSKHAWRYKQVYAALAIALIIPSVLPLFSLAWPLGLIYTYVSLYRLFNLARLSVDRLPEKHLRGVSLRSFYTLVATQLFVILIGGFIAHNHAIDGQQWAMLLAIGSVVGGLLICIATIANLYGSRPRRTAQLTEGELPTLTVAIAARNETPTLMSCLESVVSSDYPKLEILVLDDDSQDTTAEIIRSFAQQGVRFVDWNKLNGEWLSKNRAYETLLQHSSGELIFFMGVDVRLHEQSLRRVVEQLLERNVAMMTLVPKRTKSGILAIFIQPMRYWWELAIPHALRRRPPALSTSWIITKAQLEKVGGFTSYKRSIIPEEHLARHFYALDSYAFVRTTKDMLITTHKSFFSQWDTQVRTRYPHSHRRPELALLQTVLLACFVLWPFLSLPLLFFSSFGPLYSWMIGISISLYLVSHVAISVITNPVAGFFAPLNFPLAIVLDIIALHVSMFKYEFSKVIWKGRDIVPKKLQVIAKLPAIDDAIPSSESKH